MPSTASKQISDKRRTPLPDGIYDRIKSMLLGLEISPGAHLGIDVLARDLSVSQTPVREALARLEADGLVTKVPLRGYRATGILSAAEVEDLYRFRLLVEPWSASEAARRATRRQLENIDGELERALRGSRTGVASTYADWFEHDTRFHLFVAQASGSHFVEDALVRSHTHMHLFRLHQAFLHTHDDEPVSEDPLRRALEDEGRDDKQPIRFAEHSEIAEAIREGNSSMARVAMQRHIDASRLRIIRAVEELERDS